MSPEPETLESLLPADTPAYMMEAWLGCMHWALGDPGIVAVFRKQTGNQYQLPTNGLERMIDEATGVQRDFVFAFVRWASVHVWGPIDGPDEVTLTAPPRDWKDPA